jgi:4-carboxymuconolactone decarboxylase
MSKHAEDTGNHKIFTGGKYLTLTNCTNKKTINHMEAINQISIFPKGNKLPNDWFTGDAFLHPLIAKDANNEFSAGAVTFETNARTVWHTHPKGQVLIVIEGEGLYQEKGKPAQLIKKGDVINIPENTIHWHGASASSKMVHIAITNYKNDVQVTWLQAVSEEEYAEANKK